MPLEGGSNSINSKLYSIYPFIIPSVFKYSSWIKTRWKCLWKHA